MQDVRHASASMRENEDVFKLDDEEDDMEWEREREQER